MNNKTESFVVASGFLVGLCQLLALHVFFNMKEKSFINL